MEITVRTELGELASQWDDLVLSMPMPSPFLRSWWIDNAADGEPIIVLCTEGGRLFGGLALQRSVRLGCDWLEMLGSGSLEPDHLDVVAGPERSTDVYGAIEGWLKRSGSRVLDLRGLNDGSALGSIVPRGIVRLTDRAPYAELPDDFAAYLASRPGRFRSTVKRTTKRLTKAGHEVRVASSADAVRALDTLRSLHEVRWGDRSGFMGGWDVFAPTARAAMSAGEAEISELVDADGVVVASELEFTLAGRLFYYQSGRVETHELRGSGTMLRADIVERGIDSGITEFDLLRGEESYKEDWVNATRRLMEVRSGVGARGLATVGAVEANRVIQYEAFMFKVRREARKHEKAGREVPDHIVESLKHERTKT